MPSNRLYQSALSPFSSRVNHAAVKTIKMKSMIATNPMDPTRLSTTISSATIPAAHPISKPVNTTTAATKIRYRLSKSNITYHSSSSSKSSMPEVVTQYALRQNQIGSAYRILGLEVIDPGVRTMAISRGIGSGKECGRQVMSYYRTGLRSFECLNCRHGIPHPTEADRDE